MADQMPQPNQQPPQWVPVPAPGVTEPEPKKPMPPWLRMVIVALMTLVGIGLIVLFVWGVFFAGRTGQPAVVEDESSQAIADCRANAQDVDSCIQNVAMQLAQENGNADFCKDYVGDEYDDCVMLAAMNGGNVRLCDDVKNEEKQTQCTNAVLARTLDASTPKECEAHSDQVLKDRCVESVVRQAALAGNCTIAGVTPEMCDAGAVIRQATAERNPGLCSRIEGDWFDSCIEIVGDGDVDMDGVLADDERINGTSDTNPDTDGDGFDDKTEIDNGFDPLN